MLASVEASHGVNHYIASSTLRHNVRVRAYSDATIIGRRHIRQGMNYSPAKYPSRKVNNLNEVAKALQPSYLSLN